MRRQVIPQTARRGDTAIRRRLLLQIGDLADQGVDLLLLAHDDAVEFVEQVFGEAGLDLELGQALVCAVGFHGAIGQDFYREAKATLISASSGAANGVL
jgi:hypothetical protein